MNDTSYCKGGQESEFLDSILRRWDFEVGKFPNFALISFICLCIFMLALKLKSTKKDEENNIHPYFPYLVLITSTFRHVFGVLLLLTL